MRKKLPLLGALSAFIVMAMPMLVLAAEKEAEKPALYATGWAVLPPLIAIVPLLPSRAVESKMTCEPLIDTGIELRRTLQEQVLNGVSAEELETFRQLIHRINANIEAMGVL